MPVRLSNLLINLINIILYLIGFFLGLRIIMKFFSANPATPFVGWVYDTSGLLISPLKGIFPDFGTGIGVLDIVAIISLISYLLIGYFLMELFRSFSKPALTEGAHSIHYHDIDKDLEEEEEEHHHHRHSS
ncbi:YggT family protein [Candidatus Daviesbacteria bacterium]|nr:YggT family protein [Candidatus Daviesbacteria bacterium]